MAVTTPLPELSVRLAGRNQTFTAGAPAAVVLLPQLINNGHPIVARHGRTGSRIVRNLLNPATSALLPSLPRNCGFRFLVRSGNLSGKSVGPAWGKPVKAWQRDLHPTHIETELSSLQAAFSGFVYFPTFPQGGELLSVITRSGSRIQ